MATLNEILTYARYQCQTDTNGLSDAMGMAFANDALENFIRELIQRGIDAAQVQESYTNLLAGQGTYAYPSNKFFLKTVEVNTGTGLQGDFTQAGEVDVANLQGGTSFDYLRLNQPAQSPLLDDRGDTFEVFPTPTVSITGGIKIIYFLTPTEYTSTASIVTYPASLDYRCLASRVSALYSKQAQDLNAADTWDKEYLTRLEGIIKILAPNSQQPITPTPLQETGWNL